MSANSTPAVQMRSITKNFGAFRALDSVDFTVQPGTIHALIGENGAGKTTLVNALYGLVQPDSGQILVHGQSKPNRSPKMSVADGVGMISQHYAVIPELTNLENLLLGAEPGWWISKREAVKRADQLAESMDVKFDWGAESETLSPAQAQQLEILKLLWRDSRVMILDEPTAMLSPEQSAAMYASLKSLVQSGRTVIVVTHRLSDVVTYADEVTVLRGGKMVGATPISEVTSDDLARMIVGKELDLARNWDSRPRGDAKLVGRGLVVMGERRNRAVDGADFVISEGEIVGIAGIDGNGQHELMEALVGVLPIAGGSLVWDGSNITRTSTAHRIELGFRVVPEDRLHEGSIEGWSVEENIRLGLQRQPAAESEAEPASIPRFGAKVTSRSQMFGSLSGGNQQRIVLGRAVTSRPTLLLATQLARGLDFQATASAYAALRESGCPSLVVGFDLDELIQYCDRIVVMRDGVLYSPPGGFERDRQTIGKMMVGSA